MSLTKTTTVDQITVSENGIVLYREATRIMEDGNQISQTYHRSSLTPAQDLTGVPANVVAICNAAWTPEVIAAYQAEQARIAAEREAQRLAAEAAQQEAAT
jgi:regulator of protease activity HflC (stomatin/prohibitin superfamily)